MNNFDIKELEYSVDKYDYSYLKLELSGEDICYPVVNALRKITIGQIPIYAFHPHKINILRNNSIFDNTYMRERLSQLPIRKINHDVKYLSQKYYKDVNFADPKNILHDNDTNEIEIYVKAKNIGPEKLLNISTNDIRLTINNEIVDPNKMYSKDYPILLIQLRQGEEIEFSMKGVLAIGELDSIFNASNTFYDEITDHKYELTVESNGQFDEYEVLIRGCEIIIEKLGIIKENILSNQYQIVLTENNSMIVEILNEDYTCGGPINYILQGMDKVIFSGVTNPDFMQKNIVIKFKVNDKYKPVDVFIEAVDKTEDLFKNILKKFKHMSGKTKIISEKEDKVKEKVGEKKSKGKK